MEKTNCEKLKSIAKSLRNPGTKKMAKEVLLSVISLKNKFDKADKSAYYDHWQEFKQEFDKPEWK
jgi:hypothetical protein